MSFKKQWAAALFYIACRCVSAWKWGVWNCCWQCVLDSMIITHALQARMQADCWVGIRTASSYLHWDCCTSWNFVSFTFVFVADSVALHQAKVHRLFNCRSPDKQMPVRGIESGFFVISAKWLIIVWLAGSTVPLADVAGRPIAVTNAQSCSKAISSFCSIEPMNSNPVAPLLLFWNPTHATHPTPHLPQAFPHVHSPPMSTQMESSPQGHGHLIHTTDH